jgi:hypothetical protein
LWNNKSRSLAIAWFKNKSLVNIRSLFADLSNVSARFRSLGAVPNRKPERNVSRLTRPKLDKDPVPKCVIVGSNVSVKKSFAEVARKYKLVRFRFIPTARRLANEPRPIV